MFVGEISLALTLFKFSGIECHLPVPIDAMVLWGSLYLPQSQQTTLVAPSQTHICARTAFD
jgi:hypothetical protein